MAHMKDSLEGRLNQPEAKSTIVTGVFYFYEKATIPYKLMEKLDKELDKLPTKGKITALAGVLAVVPFSTVVVPIFYGLKVTKYSAKYIQSAYKNRNGKKIDSKDK